MTRIEHRLPGFTNPIINSGIYSDMSDKPHKRVLSEFKQAKQISSKPYSQQSGALMSTPLKLKKSADFKTIAP